MRFIIRFLLMGVIGYVSGSYFPEWSLWPLFGAGLLIGLLLSRQKKKRKFGKRKMPRTYAFWAGFSAIFVLWAVVTYLLDQGNEGILSMKIAQILPLGEALGTNADLGMAMILLTATIGGLVGGVSMMTGNWLGEAIRS